MTDGTARTAARRRSLRAASAILFLHGGFELAGLWLLFAPQGTLPEPYGADASFYGLIRAGYGAARAIAAVGIWSGRTWAVALGILCCGASLVVAPSIRPFGGIDLLLSLPALVLLLGVWFGNGSIE